MFDFTLGLKGTAIAVLVTAAVTAATTARICDADRYRSKVEALERALDRQQVAAESAAAERDRIRTENQKLSTQVADYEDKLEARPACVDPAAARRLRDIR